MSVGEVQRACIVLASNGVTSVASGGGSFGLPGFIVAVLEGCRERMGVEPSGYGATGGHTVRGGVFLVST